MANTSQVLRGEFGKVLLVANQSLGSSSTAVGSNLNVTNWTASYTRSKHDITTTGSLGFNEYQLGCKHIDFSIDAFIAVGTMPWGTTLGLTNTDFAVISLYTLATNVNPDFALTLTVLDKIDLTSKTDDVETYKITGSSSGVFTVTAS
jgi:hypothetical protein